MIIMELRLPVTWNDKSKDKLIVSEYIRVDYLGQYLHKGS